MAEGVSDRLRQLAPRHGDVTDLSKSTGIARTTLGNWLKGRGEPDLSNAAKIARAAGVSLAWLATGEGHRDDPASAAPQAAEKGGMPFDEQLLRDIIIGTRIEMRTNKLRPTDDEFADLVLIRYKSRLRWSGPID